MARPARISAWGRSLLAVLLLTLCGLPQSWAQKAVRLDTTVFRPTQLIAPGALIVSGIAIHGLAHESWDFSVREGMQNWRAKGGEVPFYEEILRYMPAVPLTTERNSPAIRRSRRDSMPSSTSHAHTTLGSGAQTKTRTG